MSKVFFCEVPDHVWDALNSYIETHPGKELDSAVTGALSLFLLQNPPRQDNNLLAARRLSRTYLDCLFKEAS